MPANPAPFALAPAVVGAYVPDATTPGPPPAFITSQVVTPAVFGYYELRTSGPANPNNPTPSSALK